MEKTVIKLAAIATIGIGIVSAIYILCNRKKKEPPVQPPAQLPRKTDTNLTFYQPDHIHTLYSHLIYIVKTPERCRYVVELLRKQTQLKFPKYPVLGFDCEWVGHGENRNPVALIQLATYDGYCVLIQLSEMSEIPDQLYSYLNDPGILKVGIGAVEAAKYLLSDYNLQVAGVLDIRHLAKEYRCPEPYGIVRLAKGLLGATLDKEQEVSESNWEAAELTQRQIQYAADDAVVGCRLFIYFVGVICRKRRRRAWNGWNVIIGVCEKFTNQSFD